MSNKKTSHTISTAKNQSLAIQELPQRIAPLALAVPLASVLVGNAAAQESEDREKRYSLMEEV
ncbi:MAG: hypothetical protein AAF749_14975, partial [Pseudomonadota bacterium]